MSTFRPSILEPLNKRTHLRCHVIRGRPLKVNLALTDGPRDHLHGFRMSAVSPLSMVRSPFINMSCQANMVSSASGFEELRYRVDHHLCDAAFGRRHAGLLPAEAKLVPQRRLNAVAVEDFALDF